MILLGFYIGKCAVTCARNHQKNDEDVTIWLGRILFVNQGNFVYNIKIFKNILLYKNVMERREITKSRNLNFIKIQVQCVSNKNYKLILY